ncbi:MAG: M20 family metallopeptidase [Eubacteriales bacterium]|nr:M20 family metallopeptidase [Eubacteriales bacterium]
MRIYEKEERLALLTADRRNLHKIPEYGYDLPETRKYIMNVLQETSPDVLEMCDEGIKAVYFAKTDEPAIAFRSDMDALKQEERTGCAFASKHPGMMHACGHDGHMATLLMLARILDGRRSQLRRSIVLLFQPAEENFGGARRMIQAGALENPKVGEIYGMHMMPQIPKGKIGCKSGALMSLVDAMRIVFLGKSAHGAAPQQGNDAICAMAHFVLSCQSAIARRISPFEPSVFTVGTVQAGTAFNIVANRAEITASTRGYSHETAHMLREIIDASIDSANRLYGTRSEKDVWVSYPAVVNDAEKTDLLRRLAGDLWMDAEPVTVSEDFSEFQKEIPGVYFFLGYGDAEHHAALHSADFDFDETALLTGAEIYERLAFRDMRA